MMSGSLVKLRFVLGLVLLIGVVVRAVSVASVPRVDFGPGGRDRGDVIERIRSAALGDAMVRPFGLNLDANVVLGVGDDGQPGQAGVNDNADASLDDPGELGAVGSDDVCLAPSDPGYQAVADAPQSIVISKGAFVETNADAASRYLVDGFGWVIVD